MNVSANKKTLYEILEVSPTASYADIKAAHKRLSLKLMSLGLSREDCDFNLNLLDVALHTLSVPISREAYDAELVSATIPGKALIPIKTNAMSLVDAASANQIAAALESSQKLAAAMMQTHQFPAKEVSSTVRMSAKSLKIILRIVIGLLVLGFFIRMGQTAVAFRHAGQPTSDELKAEEKLIIQEYYRKHGVRPASRAEAELLEQENRSREHEQRAAKAEERKKEDEYHRFVEESRREGEYVHEDLVRNEEIAQREQAQRQRDEAERKRRQEEAAQRAEDMRIAKERRKLGLEPNPGTNERAYAGEYEER